MKNLLVIEDSSIKAMMSDPRIATLLPCLNTAQRQMDSTKRGQKNCQRCKGEKKQIVADAMNQAKTCIRSLKGGKLTKLKKVLGARQLRVVARNGSGQRVKYTL